MADEPSTETSGTNPRKVREGIVGLDEDGQDGRRRGRRPGAAPPLQKTVQRTKRLYAHDETNDVREGDRVRHQRDAAAVEAEALARRRSARACRE